MRRKISLFLILVLVLGMLSGCGGDEVSEDLDENNQSNQVDIIYYAYNSEPILNWDPSIMFSSGLIVLHNVYETLLKFDPKTKEFEPLLATSYVHSEDGLTWTFKLREGVKFHDGTDFNAEAVKYSIERTINIGKGASYIWDPVEKINVKDDYTVEFKLSYSAPLDLIVSSPYAAFIMSPSVEEKPDDWFEQGNEAGTGPYMLESNKMGDEVILTKFDDYWKGWEGKHFDKAIIKKTSETSSRRQMIEKGEADITMGLPAEDVDALKLNDDVKVMPEPSFVNIFALINTQKPPLNNVKVRQALSYAFPYEYAVKYAAGGYAKQARGAIPHGHWGHGEDLFQYSLDSNKAKSLLEEAGINEGELKLLLTYMSGDEAEKKIAELYKAELSKIGVELEIRAMPWESQWEMAMSNDPEDRQDIFIIYWWPDISNPYTWLNVLFHTEENILYNLSYYSNTDFDNMIDNAYKKSGTNIDEAEKEFIEAQKILLEDCPSIFIYDKETVWITSQDLKGFEDNPLYPWVVFFYDCYRD